MVTISMQCVEKLSSCTTVTEQKFEVNDLRDSYFGFFLVNFQSFLFQLLLVF